LFAAVLAAGVMVQAARDPQRGRDVVRAAVPPGAIKQVMVIDLENEDFASTFGPASPAVFLNTVLLSQGELIPNYFATSHVSLGNYISQVSGQGPTVSTNNDCLNLASLTHPPVVGGFTDVLPGVDAADPNQFPGQVVGDGCVFPAPANGAHGAQTIGDQVDALKRLGESGHVAWREYAEDMGDNPARDYGTPDPLGGTDCAHPPIGGVDHSNSATASDQYATRHNPFVYFHSVIDDVGRCNEHVVPLGKLTVGQNGAPDQFQGHLFEDLSKIESTPAFMFVTPNLCDDGHDAACAGTNVEGGKAGGLVGADLWLKHWMPMILDSPAYRSGQLLVVLTFDESGLSDARACPAANQPDCHAPSGPNVTNFGFSSVLALFGLQSPPPAGVIKYPGGGKVGAVLFNRLYVTPGSVNTTGVYTHFTALRSYEDLLGVTRGGDDGFGHLGFAALPGLQPFGEDVFNAR
jgi:hypothetical protein